MRALLLLSFVVPTFVLGCGGAEGDRDTAVAKYKAQCEALRAKFREVAAMLPARDVTGDSPRRELNPPPFIKKNGDTNFQVVQAEHLLDPEARLGAGGKNHELQFSNDILNCLRWTGPKAQDYLQGKFLEPTFQRGLATRYLVVLRTTFYRPVVDTHEVREKAKVFEGGQLAGVATLVDLANLEVVAVFPVSADSEGLKVKSMDEFDRHLSARTFSKINDGLKRITNASIYAE